MCHRIEIGCCCCCCYILLSGFDTLCWVWWFLCSLCLFCCVASKIDSALYQLCAYTHSLSHIKYRCIAIINKSTQNVRVQRKKKYWYFFYFACYLPRLSLGNFFLLWKRKKTHWCLSVLGLNLWCACCKHSTRNEKKETTQIYPNQVKISHATFQGKKKKYTDTLHIRLQKTKHPYTWVYLIRKSSI